MNIHSVPYLYGQPIQSSDNRPSENDDPVQSQHVPKSGEKSSSQSSSNTPSEDAFIGSDSDDRGEMLDVVSESTSSLPPTACFQCPAWHYICFPVPRQDKPIPALIQCKVSSGYSQYVQQYNHLVFEGGEKGKISSCGNRGLHQALHGFKIVWLKPNHPTVLPLAWHA